MKRRQPVDALHEMYVRMRETVDIDEPRVIRRATPEIEKDTAAGVRKWRAANHPDQFRNEHP